MREVFFMCENFYKLSLLCFFILLSKFSFAFNLGEIEVISKPNQAFLANIDLLFYTKSELDGLRIKLASDEEYQKFDIERNSLLKKLQFSVEGNEDDGLYVQLHAGYLAKDFPASILLEVSWPGGQMVKQYNISSIKNNDIINSEDVELLYKQFQAAIDAELVADDVSSLGKNQAIDQLIERIKNKQLRSMPLVEKMRETPLGGIEYSPVESGESISKIARLLTTNKELSTNQVMVALFNENRDAFMDNNIHRLRVGVTLKIENENSIALISKKEASRLAQQYMSSARTRREFEGSLIADNVFSEDVIKSKGEKKVVKHLEIVSANEGLISQDILKRIKAEELAKSEEEIRIANSKLQALQSEITFLKKRIIKLENNTGIKDDNLFLEDVDLPTNKKSAVGNSATIQEENLVLVSTGLSLEENDKAPFLQDMEKYKTTILFGSVALLLISLLGFRYKIWFTTLARKFS